MGLHSVTSKKHNKKKKKSMANQKTAEIFPSAIKALKSSALCSIVPGVQGFMLAFLLLEIFSGREK